MRYFNLFSFFILSSSSALTQDVPIDMSLAEFDQSDANLAIHFVAGTEGERAKEIVEDLGYELVSFDFGTVKVFGESDELMSESELAKIQIHDKIADASQVKAQSPPSNPAFGDLGIKFVPRVLVTLEFEAGIGEKEARRIASKYRAFNIRSISPARRDISIKVAEESEDEVIEKLESFEEVDYVVYLKADSVPFLQELEIDDQNK